jgi:glycerol-3-phosphate O-acyltransferase
LRYNKEKEIISEDFSLLYYYHNRLDNYHLDEVIDLKKDAMLTLEPV